MYSYEDRRRAVRLYIKLDARTDLTIRQFGYPTKNTLEAWHREYEQRHDLPASYARRLSVVTQFSHWGKFDDHWQSDRVRFLAVCAREQFAGTAGG